MEEDTDDRLPAPWRRGDTVRIVSGPFAQLTGKIDDVNLDRQKLRILISIYGRETPVELEFAQVERV